VGGEMIKSSLKDYQIICWNSSVQNEDRKIRNETKAK